MIKYCVNLDELESELVAATKKWKQEEFSSGISSVYRRQYTKEELENGINCPVNNVVKISWDKNIKTLKINSQEKRVTQNFVLVDSLGINDVIQIAVAESLEIDFDYIQPAEETRLFEITINGIAGTKTLYSETIKMPAGTWKIEPKKVFGYETGRPQEIVLPSVIQSLDFLYRVKQTGKIFVEYENKSIKILDGLTFGEHEVENQKIILSSSSPWAFIKGAE